MPQLSGLQAQDGCAVGCCSMRTVCGVREQLQVDEQHPRRAADGEATGGCSAVTLLVCEPIQWLRRAVFSKRVLERVNMVLAHVLRRTAPAAGSAREASAGMVKQQPMKDSIPD